MDKIKSVLKNKATVAVILALLLGIAGVKLAPAQVDAIATAVSGLFQDDETTKASP